MHHIHSSYIHPWWNHRPDKMSLRGYIHLLLLAARRSRRRVIARMGGMLLDNRWSGSDICSDGLLYTAILAVRSHRPGLLVTRTSHGGHSHVGHGHHHVRRHARLPASLYRDKMREHLTAHCLHRGLNPRWGRRGPGHCRYKFRSELLRPGVERELLGVRVEHRFFGRIVGARGWRGHVTAACRWSRIRRHTLIRCSRRFRGASSAHFPAIRWGSTHSWWWPSGHTIAGTIPVMLIGGRSSRISGTDGRPLITWAAARLPSAVLLVVAHCRRGVYANRRRSIGRR